MYLIEILHQTTTPSSLTYSARPLYLIEILHQTTTTVAFSVATACCILSKFYIKPQPSRRRLPTCGVVSYRNSTSNHNPVQIRNDKGELYLIEILHQTTTFRIALFASMGCILSKFYIKPQLACGWYDLRRVVSYRNSTSNHNSAFAIRLDILLYLIEILHQTTTKTFATRLSNRCILSKFYIKPQQLRKTHGKLFVVSYRNSTSNHNNVLYNTIRSALYLIEILHQTTTPQSSVILPPPLYLIEILHQTTTTHVSVRVGFRCILSKFYIKPQLWPRGSLIYSGCILSKFYIKPQLMPLY